MVVFGMFAVRNNVLLKCLQLLRGRIWTCMASLVYVLVGFWNRDYASQLPYVRYYVVVKSSFKHAREECESKRAYVF